MNIIYSWFLLFYNNRYLIVFDKVNCIFTQEGKKSEYKKTTLLYNGCYMEIYDTYRGFSFDVHILYKN